jgi:DnaK suppressor protein
MVSAMSRAPTDTTKREEPLRHGFRFVPESSTRGWWEIRMNIEHFRRRLLELDRELVKRVGLEVDAARNTRDDQPEAGDHGRVDELKDQYFALADTDSAILEQVRAALERIDDGTFGQCVMDGSPIEEQRLEAVPWTALCLKHQQEIEDQQPLRTPAM